MWRRMKRKKEGTSWKVRERFEKEEERMNQLDVQGSDQQQEQR